MVKTDAEQNAVWLDQLREAGRSEAVIARVRVALEVDEQDAQFDVLPYDRMQMLHAERISMKTFIIDGSGDWALGHSDLPSGYRLRAHRRAWTDLAKRILTLVGARERAGGR